MDTYTPKDILRMAIQAKTNGVELYLVLARDSNNYHVGRLFMELAKDEQKHKFQLERWRESMDEGKALEAYPGERALYLKALVDENAFHCDSAKKKALEMTISEEEALQAGITFEKDFMLFLHDLKHYAGGEAKETIDFIIDEEVKNLRELFHLQDKIK